MKKILLVALGLVVVVPLGGRAIWAYQQMKKNEPVSVQQTQAPSIVAADLAVPTAQQQSADQPLTTTQTVEVHESSTQKGLTVNANIKADVTTTTSCGTPGCFQEKFYACQPATLNADAGDLGAVTYTILKPLDSQHCRMTFRYTKVANPDWLNKDLTCTYLNKTTTTSDSNAFEEKVKSMLEEVIGGSGGNNWDYCEGALYAVFQPEKAAARASRQIPSAVTLDALNYTNISISKINEYIGKQVSFKVSNPLPGIKFCMGSINTSISGKIQASDEIIAHQCSSEAPLIYDSATKTVSMPAFTTEMTSAISRDFLVSRTDSRASLVLEFYALDTLGRESNHLSLTFTK